MIIGGRSVELKVLLLNWRLFRNIFRQFEPKKGRGLTTASANYVLDVVAPNPYIFAEYAGRPTPEKMYRRVIFNRRYIIVYKVTNEPVTFLSIYHTSHNPDSISLEE